MLLFRFRVKVTLSWLQGANIDVAIDDFAMGAACFDTGTLLVLDLFSGQKSG